MKFNSFKTHKTDFLFRILFLFLAHECVWQFRGHTPVRSTGNSVWIKMFQVILLYWSVLQWRTFLLRNLVFLTDLNNFFLLLPKSLVNWYAHKNISEPGIVSDSQTELSYLVWVAFIGVFFKQELILSYTESNFDWTGYQSKSCLVLCVCYENIVLFDHRCFSGFRLYCVVIAN